MLWRLAILSAKYKKEHELLKVSKEFLSISRLNQLHIEWHFEIMGYLMNHDEFTTVEEFLEFIEQWTEERFIKENERIKRES